MHLWVGEAIMPQITTWLIVSEQMSRLSEIWAWLVRKLFFRFLLDLAKFIDKVLNQELYIRCGLPDMKWLKKENLQIGENC